LIERGMPQPLFVVSNGGKGLKAALNNVSHMPAVGVALPIRCAI